MHLQRGIFQVIQKAWQAWLKPKAKPKLIFKPVGLKEFRLKAAQFILFQILTFGIAWSLFRFGKETGSLYLQIGAMLGLALLQFYLALITGPWVCGRMVDISPSITKPHWLHGILLVSPIVAIGFSAYLCLAKSASGTRFSSLATRPWAVIVCVLALIASPVCMMGYSKITSNPVTGMRLWSYWTSNYTSYFFFGMVEEVVVIKQAAWAMRSNKRSVSSGWRLEQYSKNVKPGFTGMTLIMAFEGMHAESVAAKTRRVASYADSVRDVTTLESIYGVLEIFDKANTSKLPDINPFVILNAAGMFEFAVARLFEIYSEADIRSRIVKEIRHLISSVKLKTTDRSLVARVNLLREQFEQTRFFRVGY